MSSLQHFNTPPFDFPAYWKPIPGHPAYFASPDGQILSLKQRKPRILRPQRIRGGYRIVRLTGQRFYYVHRIVLLTFEGPQPPDHEAGHLDFDVANNSLFNLRWLPRSINRRRKQTTAHLFH